MEERIRQLKAELFQKALMLEMAEMGAAAPQDLSYNDRFGLLLKTVREFRGLSQAQLQKRSKVRETTISRLERGMHAPQERTVADLARGLKVPADQLDPDRVFRDWPGYLDAVLKELREFANHGQAPIEQPEKAKTEA